MMNLEPHDVAMGPSHHFFLRSAVEVGQATMLPFMATVSTVSLWPAKILEFLRRVIFGERVLLPTN